MPIYYREKTNFEIVTKEKIKEYLNNSEKEDLKVLLALAWLTGARLSELLLLRKKDFIINNDEIKIIITTLKQKSKPLREIIISINDPFSFEILNYINNITNNEEKLYKRCKRTYQKWLLSLNKKLYSDNEKEYITFHYLRHSLISYLARELRASGWEIQSWTGHKSSAYEEYIIKTATDRFKGKLGLRR